MLIDVLRKLFVRRERMEDVYAVATRSYVRLSDKLYQLLGKPKYIEFVRSGAGWRLRPAMDGCGVFAVYFHQYSKFPYIRVRSSLPTGYYYAGISDGVAKFSRTPDWIVQPTKIRKKWKTAKTIVRERASYE